MITRDSKSQEISLKNKILFRIKTLVQSTLISRSGLSLTLSSGIGIHIENYADWIIYNEIFADGVYRPALDLAISMFDNRRPPKFLDLGANVGFFTLYVMDTLRRHSMHSLKFEIKAIEPSPTVFQTLKSRVGTESRPGEKIEFYNGLVGRRSGSGTLFEIGYHAMSSIVPRRFSHSTVVPFLNLEDICSDMEAIDLLKCDIEGAEEEFLSNWKPVLDKTRCAVLEFHPKDCNIDACVAALALSGLRERQVLRASKGASVELFWR